ncbi:MAG: RsmB/NOP family class I SAM-dependent RNA methyltransferase, partial [Lachnospiraceae bacterium]|nr:RsmB/NOP family class I SAM-dependent RNA methyltransferase [Lachnospiraceae bacterium]
MTQTTLPNDFLLRMKALLPDAFDAFCKSYESPAFHGVFLNAPAGSGDASLELLAKSNLTCEDQVPWEQNGYYYHEALPFGKHILHEGGFYYIQEPSAMAPANLLDPRPGERILDLCASPGGKTTQIGVKLQGRGLLVSNEIHPQRAAVLSENVERMGLSNVVVTNAAPDALSARFPLFFDRILVDAPCSGEGMFRKNPEAALQWSMENVQLCRDRQEMILSHADLMLSPGGYLAYSTCTFSGEENEEMILRFLNTHPQYEA